SWTDWSGVTDRTLLSLFCFNSDSIVSVSCMRNLARENHEQRVLGCLKGFVTTREGIKPELRAYMSRFSSLPNFLRPTMTLYTCKTSPVNSVYRVRTVPQNRAELCEMTFLPSSAPSPGVLSPSNPTCRGYGPRRR